jgi:hypothetical protein
LDTKSSTELARVLADDPFTFGIRFSLKRGIAEAFMLGEPENFLAVVVKQPWVPDEPFAIGTDAEAIWKLLQRVRGWYCVNVRMDLGPSVARVLERELGLSTNIRGDVYFMLQQPAVSHHHPSVRLLTSTDVPLIDRAPPELRGGGYLSTVQMVTEGIVAGAVLDGKLISIMVMSAYSERYADIGGHTLEPWRNQGMGSAELYLVSQEAQARGLTPVWSTGEDNSRSQRVARKVGFHEFGSRSYVIVSMLKESGGFRPTS